MPDVPAPGGAAADGPTPGAASPAPTSVRVAVVLMAMLAVMLLFYAAITWLGREGLAEAVGRARPELSRAAAARYVLVSAAPYLCIGVLLAVSAWFLPRRRRWACWTGVVTAFLLAGLMLLGMASIGGITPISLLVLVLAVATVASLLARSTTDWFTRPGVEA